MCISHGSVCFYEPPPAPDRCVGKNTLLVATISVVSVKEETVGYLGTSRPCLFAAAAAVAVAAANSVRNKGSPYGFFCFCCCDWCRDLSGYRLAGLLDRCLLVCQVVSCPRGKVDPSQSCPHPPLPSPPLSFFIFFAFSPLGHFFLALLLTVSHVCDCICIRGAVRGSDRLTEQNSLACWLSSKVRQVQAKSAFTVRYFCTSDDATSDGSNGLPGARWCWPSRRHHRPPHAGEHRPLPSLPPQRLSWS